MAEPLRIERGWIYVDGTRQDDGTFALGTGGELRFNPFEALGKDGKAAGIPGSAVLTASLQRLVFWKR